MEYSGVGRRYSNLVCKKADVDLNKRCVLLVSLSVSPYSYNVNSAGELTSEELERVVTILQNPTQYKSKVDSILSDARHTDIFRSTHLGKLITVSKGSID